MNVISDNQDPIQIRPIDNSTDLIDVANLIETCFSDHMDADGYEYLNHIRRAARDTRFLRWIPGAGEMASYPLHGYVWVENGKIIGNLTLIPVFVQDHWNYLIVNVAVHPDYRRRGIARQLTSKGLQHIQDHGAFSAWLQVRDDNPGAISLYQSLGFAERAQRTTWITDQAPYRRVNLPHFTVLPRKDSEWPLQKDWLNRSYPPVVSWHLPISINKFKPSFFNKVEYFFSDLSPKNWTCYKDNRPIGFATLESTRQSVDYIWLAVGEEYQDEAVKALLDHIRQNSSPFRPLTINYASHLAVDSFKSTGFIPQNTLIWMEAPFQSASIPIVKRLLDKLVTF